MNTRSGPASLRALLLVAGLALVAALAWAPTALGVWHDDGVYLMLGRALAQGEGLRYLGVSGAPPAPKFPPLFPGVLAGVWKVAPDFPDNTALFQLLNLGILVAAGALFYGYARRALELPVPVALVGTGLAWLSPGLWSLAVIPLSEPLFVLCLVLSVWAATRLEEVEGSGLREAAFFLGAFALVFHTRTAGVAVAAGAVAALAWGRRWLRGAGVLVASGLVILPWTVWANRAGEQVPEALRGILGSYGEWLGRQILADPLTYAAGVPARVGDVVGQLVHFLTPGGPGWLRWGVAVLVLPLLAMGSVRIGSRSRSTVWVLGAYLGVIFLWPFQDSRFLVPILPWGILAVVAGGWAFMETPHSPRGRWLRRAVPPALAVWGALFVGLSVWALSTGRHARDYQTRSRALEDAVVAVARFTPPGAVVGAPEFWPALHLYTGRTVSPSAHFALGGDGPAWGSPMEQYRIWVEAGIDHILAEQGGGVHGQALDRLDQVCPGGAVGVLEIMEGQILVRLAWDRECRERLGLEG